MPIDPTAALGAPLPPVEFSWTADRVQLYHLALGAGADPTDPRELGYTVEPDLHVLPTFAVVASGTSVFTPPAIEYPGISIPLDRVLHGGYHLEVHRPLTPTGTARSRTRVIGVHDKGSAAVVVTETAVSDLGGDPLWTATSTIFARGEGGFGGDRGPSVRDSTPEREPDAELITPTLPQQALWYRLLGDRNPLHADPAVARAAGFSRPILHGLCTYGLVCKAVVDAELGGDVDRVRTYGARFAGIVHPGETLRTRVWRDDDRLLLSTSVIDRSDEPVLTGVELTIG